MTNKDLALLVAGIIFLIISILHLVRYLYKSQITIGNHILSMKFSIVGFIVSFLLSIWMFTTIG